MTTKTCLQTLLTILILSFTAAATAGQSRIAVSLFQINSKEDLGYIQNGLSSLLPPRISLPGKISVVDNEAVRRALSPPQADYSHAKKAQLASTLELDYLLTGSLTKFGDTISIDAFLFDAAEPERSTPFSVSCTGLDSLIAQVQVLAANLQRRILYGAVPGPVTPPAPTAAPDQTGGAPFAASPPVHVEAPQPRPFKQPVPLTPSAPVFAPEPQREYVIEHTPFVCMAAADLTGQGKLSLMLADPLKVSIYDPGPEELTLTASVPTKNGESIVYIDAFDLNGNGRSEIYVSSYNGREANSFIAEYTDEAYLRIAEQMPWFFSTYPSPDGIVLLGIKLGAYNPLFGTAFQFIWKDGTPTPAGEFSLPGGVSLFGSCPADIDGDQREEYIAFSRGLLSLEYWLHVLSNTGKIMWKDTMGLGGAPNSFNRYIIGDGAETAEPVPLRIRCADINGDRRAEILLPRNTKQSEGLLSRLASYNRGEMLCLYWDGSSLSQNWSSGVLDGYISDFLITDIDADGAQELVVLTVSGTGISGKARNTVRVYKQAR